MVLWKPFVTPSPRVWTRQQCWKNPGAGGGFVMNTSYPAPHQIIIDREQFAMLGGERPSCCGAASRSTAVHHLTSAMPYWLRCRSRYYADRPKSKVTGCSTPCRTTPCRGSRGVWTEDASYFHICTAVHIE
ncbi:hypothetical protein BDZ45DRAFT_388784 [Acephala macrosclerotiorum]|nr:hypothetical protein BDZ45DRAFT_388784 [Acephala macrosclerotiorum]